MFSRMILSMTTNTILDSKGLPPERGVDTGPRNPLLGGATANPVPKVFSSRGLTSADDSGMMKAGTMPETNTRRCKLW